MKDCRPDKICKKKLELPGVKPAALAAFGKLARFGKLHMKVFYNLVASREMFHAQLMYVKMIGDNEGLNQSELAELMGVERASVTTAMQRLEKVGLIQRRCDEKDQRMSRLYLTDKGREMNIGTERELTEFVNCCMDLDDETIDNLSRALDRLNDNVEQYLMSYGRNSD